MEQRRVDRAQQPRVQIANVRSARFARPTPELNRRPDLEALELAVEEESQAWKREGQRRGGADPIGELPRAARLIVIFEKAGELCGVRQRSSSR